MKQLAMSASQIVLMMRGAPYPVICIDDTVIYKICENPRIEKGEISLEDVGEVLVRQRIHYAENNLNYR